MHILLDECLDRRIASLISGHVVQTVPQAGWAGKKNGELLTLAAAQFDAFVTVDSGIEFQQDLQQYDLIVAVLQARSNRLSDLEPLVPELVSACKTPPLGNSFALEQRELDWRPAPAARFSATR